MRNWTPFLANMRAVSGTVSGKVSGSICPSSQVKGYVSGVSGVSGTFTATGERLLRQSLRRLWPLAVYSGDSAVLPETPEPGETRGIVAGQGLAEGTICPRHDPETARDKGAVSTANRSSPAKSAPEVAHVYSETGKDCENGTQAER